MGSILDETKKVLGIDASYTAFDQDILMHINSTFNKLWQFGIGPLDGYAIEDKTPTWEGYLQGDILKLNMVRSYMYLSVRLLFDPPATSYAIQAMQSQIEELGWRIQSVREERDHPEPVLEQQLNYGWVNET